MLNQQQHQAMLGRFAQDVSDYGLVVMPLQSAIVTEAIELLEGYPLRTADALHFASAVMANRAAGGEPTHMVSSDKEIREARAGYGLSFIDPEQPGAHDQIRSLR